MNHDAAVLDNKTTSDNKVSMRARLLFAAALCLTFLCMVCALSGRNAWASDGSGTSKTTGMVDLGVVDETTDLSVTHIIGTVKMTGTGGVQAGYDQGKEVYNKSFNVTYGKAKSDEVSVSETEVRKLVTDLANKCKDSGKSGEYRTSTTTSQGGGSYDNRTEREVYETTIEGVKYELELIGEYENDPDVFLFEKEDGSQISSKDCLVTKKVVKTGECKKETFIRIQAIGKAEGFDITVTNDGNGTASSERETSLAGEKVTLTPTPKDGYRFRGWNITCAKSVSADVKTDYTTFIMPDADVTFKALFEKETAEQSASGQETSFAPASEKDVWRNPIVSSIEMEYRIAGMMSDGDVEGSSFSLLCAGVWKTTKNAITLYWKKVPGAESYTVYGAECGAGNAFQKLGTLKSTNCVWKERQKGTYYKFIIVANAGGYAKAVSKTIHACTAGGKNGNNKTIKLSSKKAISLKKGKTSKIRAKAVPKNRKLKVKKHRKIRFETTNPKVATVNAAGKVNAIKKGKCSIFVYTQDGLFTEIKVTVK